MALYQVNAGDRILAADINQFYQILKGVAASGEAVTLIYNNQSLIFQPSSDPSAGTRVVLIKNTAGTVLATWRYDGLLELLSAAAAPASPIAGSIYFDSLFDAARIYDGAYWLPMSYTPTRYIATLSTVAVPAAQNLLGGTGAVTVQADGVQLDTGANANSFVRNVTPLDSGQGVSVAPFGKIKFFRAMVRPLNNIAATVVYFHGVADRATAAATVFATDKHIGFKYDPATSGNWYGTVSNGAAASTLDTGVAVALNSDALLSFQYDGTTATFWVNGVNKGTIATANCPTGAVANQGLYLTNYIDNKAVANQRLVLAHSAEAQVSAI